MLRATPTGISAVIDARGNVVEVAPWRKAGRRSTRCCRPAANSPPMFARFGNVIPLLLGFLLIFGGIVLGRRRR